VIGDGLDADGNETVSFLPGESDHPNAWDDEAAFAVGELQRGLHDATATFRAPPDAIWRDWYVRELAGDEPVYGHCDNGPWNIVRDGASVAFIDWEYSGPVDAIWDLGETVWLNAQLHDDDIAERIGLPDFDRRAAHAKLILDGYRLPGAKRHGFVDRMIELAVHSARAEAIEHKVDPDSIRAVSAEGYPVMWAVTWRARSASWMMRHRDELERRLI
jgi:hypothetical protein